MKALATVAALALASPAFAATSVLQTLPADVQNVIKETRAGCPAEKTTSGDEGLRAFTVSGADAVLVDELDLCGGECFKGINCATGFTHNVTIYVRSGNAWKKAFSVDATEPIFVSTEPYTSKFRALVLSAHAGWDLGCPVRNKDDPTAWKREKCDFIIEWDGSQFVHKPLVTSNTAAHAAEAHDGRDMTCRGIVNEVENTGGDNVKVGPCQFTIDQYTGVLITDKCRFGKPCTVRARVVRDRRGLWIKHAYSARPGR